MSIATVASQQGASQATALTKAAKAAASGSVVAGQTAGAETATAAAASTTLAGNFQSFLKLLMTQLQNQDPTSPLDTNQFTSQLVQFASVEQQINTNSSLGSLIQLTQSAGIVQSSAMVGHKISVDSDHLALQGGAAQLGFDSPAAGSVAVAVYRDDGTQVTTELVNATKGANTWKWNGADSQGTKMPDGAYRVAVAGAGADGAAKALPFSVVGTATGVEQQGKTLQLQLGALSVDFAKVKAVLN